MTFESCYGDGFPKYSVSLTDLCPSGSRGPTASIHPRGPLGNQTQHVSAGRTVVRVTAASHQRLSPSDINRLIEERREVYLGPSGAYASGRSKLPLVDRYR